MILPFRYVYAYSEIRQKSTEDRPLKTVSMGMDEQMRALISLANDMRQLGTAHRNLFFFCHRCRQTYERMDGQTDGQTVGPTNKPSWDAVLSKNEFKRKP